MKRLSLVVLTTAFVLTALVRLFPSSNPEVVGPPIPAAATGLLTIPFSVPHGKIKLYLPGDMAAGDTVSGTVNIEPAGQNDDDRNKNQTELNGYVIDVGGHKTNVSARIISFSIPLTVSPEARTITLIHVGQPVGTAEIPISTKPFPANNQLTVPTGGQQGRPVEIKCGCNGVFSPDDLIKISGTVVQPLAESPRKIFVEVPSDTPTGPAMIEVKENGAASECPFRTIGIKLSAPKTNLTRGEKTELRVDVSGLNGLTEKLPLDLINQSSSVVKMNGGDTQHFEINPGSVQSNGTYSVSRTLTGIQPGSFTIDGTVRWIDTCHGGPVADATPKPTPTATPKPTPTPTTGKGTTRPAYDEGGKLIPGDNKREFDSDDQNKYPIEKNCAECTVPQVIEEGKEKFIKCTGACIGGDNCKIPEGYTCNLFTAEKGKKEKDKPLPKWKKITGGNPKTKPDPSGKTVYTCACSK